MHARMLPIILQTFFQQVLLAAAHRICSHLLMYIYRFMQVVWVHEVLKLGFSAFFVDLDVYLFRNPLPWLMTTFPNADMVRTKAGRISSA